MATKGYMGQLLRVDLNENKAVAEAIPDKLYRAYLGGVGLSSHYLYQETNADTDPLGPDNRLIFMTGPFALSGLPSTGRHAVCAKSPLTGVWGEADIGGTWGLELKRTGFDGIIFQGKSDKPVYLLIENDHVSIEDGSAVWGKDTFETDEILREKHGMNAKVHCIGPSGEKLIPISGVMSDGRSARTAARCGLGAVMGSKNLKAIVVKGNKRPEIHEAEALKAEIKELAKHQAENRGGMHEHGTGEGLIGNELSGDLPIKNWKQGLWDNKSEKITGEVMTEKYLTKRYSCGNCIVGCGREVKIEEGPYAGVEGGGPEYETIGMIGSNLLVDDMEVIMYVNELCNRYGIDTISLGAIVGFAMECYEHGLITKEDTNGLALEWGSGEALIGLTNMIANKEYIGAVLSQGTKKAAEIIGGISSEFSIDVKGLELPAHEARVLNGIALSYATGNRGACHNADVGSRFYEKALVMPEIGHMEPTGPLAVEGKGKLIAGLQNVDGLYDSLKACTFMVWFGYDTSKLLHWLNQITGWDMDMKEFLEIGERIYNQCRLFNTRLGISRKDDTLPPRILYQPRGEGGSGDHVPPLNLMLSEYYEARGWDEFGIPTPETLTRLGLEK